MIVFVGAGSGAVDLITVRGQKLLQQADTVIYAGSLVNPEILTCCKAGVKLFNSANMTLEQVIEQMVQSNQKEELLVRLHTGDPSVYGAHREQMDILRKHDLDFEVVPGVSSFCASRGVGNETVMEILL